MLKEKFKEKLMEEKKWYTLVLTDEGEFLTTLRIPTFDRIKLGDKKRIVIEEDGVFVNGYLLYLSKAEATLFKTTYQNYICRFEIDDPKTFAKQPMSRVWK